MYNLISSVIADYQKRQNSFGGARRYTAKKGQKKSSRGRSASRSKRISSKGHFSEIELRLKFFFSKVISDRRNKLERRRIKSPERLTA